MRSCAKCIHFHHLLEQPGADGAEPTVYGECRAKPPAVFLFSHQATRLDGKTGVQIQFPAAWPQVPGSAWRSEFTTSREVH